jgi:hypothetical protein
MTTRRRINKIEIKESLKVRQRETKQREINKNLRGRNKIEVVG